MKLRTKTALRAWRRLVNFLSLLTCMYYASGQCSLGFAATMLAALAGLWWLGKTGIRISSRKGVIML